MTSPVFLHHFNTHFNDKYEITFPETSITNIIFGKNFQFEHWGEIRIKCWNSGDTALIKL